MKIKLNLKILFFSILFNFIKSTCESLEEKCDSPTELENISDMNDCSKTLNEFSNKYHTPFTKDVVMAHRGLPAIFPEHSIKGFESAYFMGAHYLETDVNLTKDKQLIIFHDPFLDYTTDIKNHPNFSNRRRSETIHGYYYPNKFFVSDFTYEELLTLYIKQRNQKRPQTHNKKFKIMLLEDLIKMVIKYNEAYKNSTGIFIEPKFPEHYAKSLNTNINQIIINVLNKFELTDKNSEKFKLCPIVLQSFDYESLLYLKSNTNLPQIALMRWDTQYNLKELKKVSDGVGPAVQFILFERIDDFFYFNGTYYENENNFRKKVVNNHFHESVKSLGSRIMRSKYNKFLCYASSLGHYVYPWNLHFDHPTFHSDPVIEMVKLSTLGVSGFFYDLIEPVIKAIKSSKDIKNK